jgi:hypothetical protein
MAYSGYREIIRNNDSGLGEGRLYALGTSNERTGSWMDLTSGRDFFNNRKIP